MEKFVGIFKSLSDGTRLRILNLLVRTKTEVCICEIMDSLGLPQSNVSKHIRELKIAGLAQEKREGRFVLYSVSSAKNDFVKNLIKTILSIPEEYFVEDIERLKKRLSLRIDGKIVVGIKRR